ASSSLRHRRCVIVAASSSLRHRRCVIVAASSSPRHRRRVIALGERPEQLRGAACSMAPTMVCPLTDGWPLPVVLPC
ncbi:MAG: hypothetical protein MUC96_27915, partial [Myxococcaceae bacterium]|nr:hypothetical protein [Myxococcaceae bacterium]